MESGSLFRCTLGQIIRSLLCNNDFKISNFKSCLKGSCEGQTLKRSVFCYTFHSFFKSIAYRWSSAFLFNSSAILRSCSTTSLICGSCCSSGLPPRSSEETCWVGSSAFIRSITYLGHKNKMQWKWRKQLQYSTTSYSCIHCWTSIAEGKLSYVTLAEMHVTQHILPQLVMIWSLSLALCWSTFDALSVQLSTLVSLWHCTTGKQ